MNEEKALNMLEYITYHAKENYVAKKAKELEKAIDKDEVEFDE